MTDLLRLDLEALRKRVLGAKACRHGDVIAGVPQLINEMDALVMHQAPSDATFTEGLQRIRAMYAAMEFNDLLEMYRWNDDPDISRRDVEQRIVTALRSLDDIS